MDRQSLLYRGALIAVAGCALTLANAATAAQNASAPASKPAEAQPKAAAPGQPESAPVRNTLRDAGEIVSQPARDTGISKREIPPVLLKAAENPYDAKGMRTCNALNTAIGELNGALGPDYTTGKEYKENRAGKIAQAGGKTIVNAIIPFRGLVREISGAAPAQRRLDAALDAGFARRGFLRGMHSAKGCKANFATKPAEKLSAADKD